MTHGKTYIVYAHYARGSDTPFYIGEGSKERARSTKGRNRYWKNKVNKLGGFEHDIIIDNIKDKHTAESIEASLITHLIESGISLTNISIGPPFGNHWSSSDLNYDKTKHPMWGKKFPGGAASVRMKRWNSERSGELSPVYGKKRPDLSARNRNPENFNRFSVPVICVETGEVFESIKAAKEFIKKEKGLKNVNINRALSEGSIAGGFHWKRQDL